MEQRPTQTSVIPKELNVNIHTEKEKVFVKKVLEMLRQKGICIKRPRLASFVAEHAPGKNEPPEEWQGYVLGRVNAHLRLLWALGQYFAEESGMYSDNEEAWHAEWEMVSPLDKVRQISLSELSELCCDAFWILLKERFEGRLDPKTHGLVLKSNWSIHAVAQPKIPPIPSRLEQLGRRMEGQIIVFRVATI